MQRADSLEKTWCWERLKAGGKGDDRGWDGWMASLTQWTWVWSSSGRWWRTRKPGVLQFIGLKRIKNNWVTEQQVKNVAYGLKYTGSRILKPLPFKCIILFHSYRDKKLQNRVYRNTVNETYLDRCKNKGFPHKEVCSDQPQPFPFEHKRSLNSTLGKTVLWNTGKPSSGSTGFRNENSTPNPSTLTYWPLMWWAIRAWARLYTYS